MRLRAVLFLSLIYLSAPAPGAQAGDRAPPALRLDTPSGLPVPRFVSLKDDETNCRIGPSRDHPVKFVFRRAGAPVLITAESVDHWRRIRDAGGDECWALKTTLKAQTHVLTRGETLLLRRPDPETDARARLASGVLARIVKRKGRWLLVTVDGVRGWINADAVWGGEVFPPPARAD